MSGEHNHSHAGTGRRGKLAVVFAITATIMVAEIIGAVISGSLALLADAGHMFTDSAGLLIALTAATLALKPATDKRTWGYQRAEIVAAAAQASVLLAVGGFIAVEGVRRLFDPPEVESTAMLWFGVIGLVGNIIGLAILASGRGENLNMKAAFLEVANDALGSVAVIVSAIVIATTGWTQVDAIVSLLIAALIVPRALILLRDTIEVLMETTPKGLDLDEVRTRLEALPHVVGVHDLHASRIDSDTPVLSAHVTIHDGCLTAEHAGVVLADLQACVARDFHVAIEHSTFQIEPASHRGDETLRH